MFCNKHSSWYSKVFPFQPPLSFRPPLLVRPRVTQVGGMLCRWSGTTSASSAARPTLQFRCRMLVALPPPLLLLQVVVPVAQPQLRRPSRSQYDEVSSLHHIVRWHIILNKMSTIRDTQLFDFCIFIDFVSLKINTYVVCMIRFTRKVNATTNYWELHVMIQMRDYLVSNKSDKFKNTIKYVLKIT